MGRYTTRRPLELSHGRPAGPRWSQYTAQLWAGWLRAGLPCYYCRHPFATRGETAHLISPIVAPTLSWSIDNLVPSHGKTGRRCPDPACDLNCNWLAHNSPDAPFEMVEVNGTMVKRDLPFDAQFLARQAAEHAHFLARRGNNSQIQGNSRKTPRRSGEVVLPFRPPPDAGRPW